MELNDQMKALLKDLGMALHQALAKDSQIKTITDQIKGSGYDIYLIMEANIALDRRENQSNGQLFLSKPEDTVDEGDIHFNSYDEAFLASLKIQVDGD